MATDPDVARAARNLITEHGAVAEAIALARAKHTEGKATGQRWQAHGATSRRWCGRRQLRNRSEKPPPGEKNPTEENRWGLRQWTPVGRHGVHFQTALKPLCALCQCCERRRQLCNRSGQHMQRVPQPVLVTHVRRGMPGERIVYRPLDPGIAAHVLEAMAPRMRWSFPRVSNALFPHPSADDLGCVAAAPPEPSRRHVREQVRYPSAAPPRTIALMQKP